MKFFFLTLSLLTVKILIAQSYNYQHFDPENGLSGLTVYKILQDHQGYLWFATETGLSRYDGKTFKNFTTADGLPDNEIIDLSIDELGQMWIMPFTNAVCYYKDGVFHNQNNDSLLALIKLEGEPNFATQTLDGKIVIIERNCVTVVWPTKEITRMQRIDNTFISPTGVAIVDKDKISLPTGYGSRRHLYGFVEIKKDSVKILEPRSAKEYLWCNKTNVLLKRNASIFRFENHFRINVEGKLKYVALPDHLISLSVISDSVVTFNCDDRVYLYDYYSGEYIDTFFLNKVVTNCFRDSEGSYWFGTNGYGAYKLTSNAFVNYNFIVEGNNLPVYSIEKNKKEILIGTNRGIIWDVDLHKKRVHEKIMMGNQGEGRVTGITKRKNKLFVATGSNHGITLFDNNVRKNLLTGASSKDLVVDNDQMLISTTVGVFKLNYDQYKLDTLMLRGRRATCAIKFKNEYYAGTVKGFFRIGTANSLDSFFLGDRIPALASRVSGLAKTKNSIWIATYGNGLIEFDGQRVINHYTQKNGLSSNLCRDIFISNDQLWVGSDKGLTQIDLTKSHPPKTYTTKDGLNSDIINCVYVENDSVFVGTPYGLTIFSPHNININSVAILNIDKVSTQNHIWLGYVDSLKLSASDNKFYINYSCVSFKSNGNINYFYRLLGLDSNWHSTKETYIDYASLPPGDYQFQLYAINAFGKKSNELKINFSIDSYFYQKAWFIILVLLSAGSIIWYFVSRRIRKIKAEETVKLKTQKRLTELEQLAFRAQMNPHFIFNCLNSIQQYIFTKSALEANKFITDFSSLIRQTLDLSAKKYISLAEEVKYISTYLSLEHTRFDKSFDYSINLANQLNTEEVFLPPLLMQPFVENAIRHGVRNLKETDGLITVDFSAEGDFLVYTLSDNGIGIEGSLKLRGKNIIEHQSKGMTLIQKRIEALNEELSKKIELRISYVDEIHKKGTKIILRLPLYI